jgi:methionyl-tRNA synthetase
MADKPKYYLTTPIYYTNGLPHIGHTYSTIVCDTIRRYKRMRGFDVVMTTGTDEHGVNVERSAQKAGIPESEYVAKMAAEWRKLWDELNLHRPLHRAILHLRQRLRGCETGRAMSRLQAPHRDDYRSELLF